MATELTQSADSFTMWTTPRFSMSSNSSFALMRRAAGMVLRGFTTGSDFVSDNSYMFYHNYAGHSLTFFFHSSSNWTSYLEVLFLHYLRVPLSVDLFFSFPIPCTDESESSSFIWISVASADRTTSKAFSSIRSATQSNLSLLLVLFTPSTIRSLIREFFNVPNSHVSQSFLNIVVYWSILLLLSWALCSWHFSLVHSVSEISTVPFRFSCHHLVHPRLKCWKHL